MCQRGGRWLSQRVCCSAFSLHPVPSSFIVRAFSGAIHLIRPLLTSPQRSVPIAQHSAPPCGGCSSWRSPGVRHATFTARTLDLQSTSRLPQMEGFAVTCPLAPDVPRLLSSSCSSPRSFGFSFLQTPPHGDALAVLLAFGSAKTWLPDFHRHSYVPCPAHTLPFAATENCPQHGLVNPAILHE